VIEREDDEFISYVYTEAQLSPDSMIPGTAYSKNQFFDILRQQKRGGDEFELP
jgi:hypothetical protein